MVRARIDSVGHTNSNWNRSISKSGKARRISIQDFTTDTEELVGIVDPGTSLPAVADLLCELGVHSMALRAGFGSDYLPSKQSLKTSKAIASKHRDQVFAVCGPTKDDVDRVLAMDTPRVVIQASCNPLFLTRQKASLEEVLQKVTDSIDYARSHGLRVSYMASDSTRTEPKTLRRLTSAIQASGCERLVLSDSLGCATPEGMYRHVSFIKKNCKIPVAVHCHNDYGLAAANALAAVEAEAEFVQTCTGGVGERAGLAALEEVVTATEYLLGMKTGINLRLLTKVSRRISELLHYPTNFKKPVTGLGAVGFQGERMATRLEDLESSDAKLLMMPYLPELVGNRVHVFLTDEADSRSLTWRLARLGRQMSPDSLAKTLQACSTLATAQHREVDDAQLLGIVEGISRQGAKEKTKRLPYMLRNKEAELVHLSADVARRTLAENEKMMLVEFVFEEKGSVPLHSHHNDQIGYVASGRVNMTVGGKIRSLNGGDSYMIEGGVEHSTFALTKATLVDVFFPPRVDYAYLPRQRSSKTAKRGSESGRRF